MARKLEQMSCNIVLYCINICLEMYHQVYHGGRLFSGYHCSITRQAALIVQLLFVDCPKYVIANAEVWVLRHEETGHIVRMNITADLTYLPPQNLIFLVFFLILLPFWLIIHHKKW